MVTPTVAKEILMTTRPRVTFHLPLPALALAMLGVLTMLAPAPGSAQTFTVLHAFTGGADGENPTTVTIGGPGILYGTTYQGGTYGWGVAFNLAHRGSGWTLDPLWEFTGGSDGANPEAGVVVGPNGALYGTTAYGGSGHEGTVFELQPSAAACKNAACNWSETVLHSFQGGANDGRFPDYGNLIFDQDGNIYGTTQYGGPYSDGTVFELSPSGGGWTISLLHTFPSSVNDGYEPLFGVIFDAAGNLYGTTEQGGGGTVFELISSGGTWTENIIADFPVNGVDASSVPETLVMDRSRDLYGTTQQGGDHDQGTVFKLSPSGASWILSTLYIFGASGECTPSGLTMDPAGNLYGTCFFGGLYGAGMVFKLANSGGYWTLADMYDFTGGSDGRWPVGTVALDASGNLYGVTEEGGNVTECTEYGSRGCGVVWEITP
jgi:uncharacterized repeat protein (TIGR03803 family)